MGSSGWAMDNIMKPQESLRESTLYSIHGGKKASEARYNWVHCCFYSTNTTMTKNNDRKCSKRANTRQTVRRAKRCAANCVWKCGDRSQCDRLFCGWQTGSDANNPGSPRNEPALVAPHCSSIWLRLKQDMDVGEGCCVRLQPADQVRTLETRPSLMSVLLARGTFRNDASTLLSVFRRVQLLVSSRPCVRIGGGEILNTMFGRDQVVQGKELCPPRRVVWNNLLTDATFGRSFHRDHINLPLLPFRIPTDASCRSTRRGAPASSPAFSSCMSLTPLHSAFPEAS